MYSIELLCDTCQTQLEYEPAEFESLSGRATVEQFPPGFICPNCGNEQPVDFFTDYE
jgi:Zn finger protein HypA/HybF involved in hydrogenase expression